MNTRPCVPNCLFPMSRKARRRPWKWQFHSLTLLQKPSVGVNSIIKKTKLYDLWWSWCHGSWQPTFPLRQGPGEKEIALLLCQGRPGSNRVWDMRPTLDVVWERVPCPKRVPLFLRTWVTWSKNQKHITAQYILAVVMFRWPIQIWVLFPSARLWCLGWW